MRTTPFIGSYVIVIVAAACSGATDPSLPSGDAGATTSSSSGATSTKPDAGARTIDPSATPGKIACGATSCAAPSVCCTDGATAECKGSVDDCPKEVITCDDLGDCDVGFCCAEESSQTPMRFSTYCRPTCITGLPRVEVCSADSECSRAGTTRPCKEHSCGGFDMKGLKTCAPLGACD